MIKKLPILICILAGCISPQQNSYVEGTSLTVGLWMPINGQIYGLQAVNYLSGKRVSVTTNQELKVESEHNISNQTFGVVNLIDNNKTRIGE